MPPDPRPATQEPCFREAAWLRLDRVRAGEFPASKEDSVRVGVGLSRRSRPFAALHEAVGQAVVEAGSGPVDAALVWFTHHHAEHVERLVEALRDRLPGARLAGAVVPGLMVGDDEVFDAPGVAAMSFHDAEAWRFASLLIRDLSDRNQQAARTLVAASGPGDLVVAFPSTSGFQAGSFSAGLPKNGSGGVLFGGGAVNLRGPDWVFTEWGPHGDAVAALVVRACDPTAGLAHSCRVVSEPMTVTAARDRLLGSLDGRPAAEVLRRLVRRYSLSEEDLGRRVLVGITDKPGRRDLARGAYVVRPLLGVEKKVGALYLGGEVEAGQQLVFVVRDVSFAQLDLNAMALELATRSRAPGPPAFSLVVNCSGRGPSFHGIPEHDACVMGASLPPAPRAGFFSSFELVPEPREPTSIHLFSCGVTLGW